MSRLFLSLMLSGSVLGSPLVAQAQDGVARFPLGSNPLTLSGMARPGVYLADQGRRAALFGTETGAFEAWVWPVKLVRDLDLAFSIPDYDEPIPASAVARTVEVRPEGATIVYSHSTFTVRQHVFVPLNEPGAVMLLDVRTVRPLEVQVRMHADFNLAWPGSFGGGYITWQGADRRFLLSQGGVQLYNAFIGSPFASGGTSHPAHDAPTVPSQLMLRFDTARASTDYIPIVIAGGAMPRDSANAAYQRILANAGRYWREKVEHYAQVREAQLQVRSPVLAIDLALEWAKVNLDQQLVCNPDLGCGLVAGFGRAGPGNYRPGFGWFFGGDAAINSLAMDGLGQFGLVRQGLEFLARYQRADGKITHEISQAAGRLPWFTDYGYTFFHGDTTPFFILACYEYWLASGDGAFLRTLWPQIARAFRWSAATDGDGDGLMENPLAGAGAIEVGGLGANLQTDIYLASVWVASLEGTRAMASAMDDAGVERDAGTLFAKARDRLESAFWLEEPGVYAFALLRGDGDERRTNDALTVWPATAMSFGLLDTVRSGRMLSEIGSSKITADWGARMLSREHPLYDSQHYNNGTVWGFVTGFAALAHYRYHRAWAGYDLIRDVARTSFDFARGRNPELMSGAFYRPLDTAVPQQFFATSMVVSPLVRGMLGWKPDAPAGRATLAPHLPADWDSLVVENLAAGDTRLNVRIQRVPGVHRILVQRSAGSAVRLLDVSLALPLNANVEAVSLDGAEVEFTVEESPHDVHIGITVPLTDLSRIEVRHRGGLEVVTPAERIPVGAASEAMRVLDFRRAGPGYSLLVEGLAGRTYSLDLRSGPGAAVTPVSGAERMAGPSGITRLRITMPGPGSGYVRREILLRG